MRCSTRGCRIAPRQLLRPPTGRSTTQRRAASSSPAPPAPRPPRPRVIFSGIQPTGVPHLGNYLGALKQWKRMQDEAEPGTKLIFSIVDLHAITMPHQRGLLAQWKREMLAALLAVGLDPASSVIFYQSTVPAHAELQWILSCTASTGYLSRMTQWKSKMSLSENVSLDNQSAKHALKHGLFSYPILQAADILVHRATHVPVGEDQRQHLEFARECVTNFNHAYGVSHLIAPETILSPAKRVMSLRNPRNKMSKSDPDPRSRILLSDSAADARAKIMAAVTDGTNAVSYDPSARPAVSNLLELLAHLEDHRSPPALGSPRSTPATAASSSASTSAATSAAISASTSASASASPAADLGNRVLAGAPLRELKTRVADAVEAELASVREKFAEIMAREDGYLDRIVEEGRAKADESAEGTMRLVREAVELGA